MKEAEKSGLLNVYLQDFANAATFRTVFSKLGQNYVFCRNYKPIPYNQIAKAPMLEDAESNGELAQVMGILKMKNPAIHLGYR